jgi:NADPH:quinone reductase-like Zn-dependent oxidoreductase
MLWTKYGPPEVLHYAEVDKPVPKDNELLIKVHAATVTAGDCELRRFDIANWIWLPVRLFMGILKPRIKILGQEFAGEVVALGSKVTDYKIGDAIYVEPGMKMGGYAQFACISDSRIMVPVPGNMSFEEAATIPTGGCNALHFLRKGKVKAGQRILINGAGGSIGTYALQIAKSYGAHVSCVDSEQKLEMLRSIGADVVIDYTKEDFTQNGEVYDLIIDIVGNSSYSRSIRSLSKNGRYILGNPRLPGMLRAPWTNMTTGKKVITALANPTKADFLFLNELIEAGKIKAVIDRIYPLEELVAAHHYVEKGLKKGNLVIRIPPV